MFIGFEKITKCVKESATRLWNYLSDPAGCPEVGLAFTFMTSDLLSRTLGFGAGASFEFAWQNGYNHINLWIGFLGFSIQLDINW